MSLLFKQLLQINYKIVYTTALKRRHEEFSQFLKSNLQYSSIRVFFSDICIIVMIWK